MKLIYDYAGSTATGVGVLESTDAVRVETQANEAATIGFNYRKAR